MMRATTRISLCILAAGALALTASAATQVNERTAHIGYAYPAGGERGTTFEVLVSGQYLRGVNAALVSGKGVHVSVQQYYPPVRMLKREQRETLMKELDDARNKRVAELGIKGPVPLFPGESFARQRLADAKRAAAEAAKKAAAEKSAGKSPDKPAAKPTAKDAKPARRPAAQDPFELPPSPYLRDIDKMSLRQLMAVADTFLNFRVNARRETNPQLTDAVVLKVTIDPDAALGNRELRLAAPLGLTNPIYFQVGALPEVREQEPDEAYRTAKLPPLPPLELPVVVNGQILPGDVDTFHFNARKGQHLVIETFARQLIPFLADAVPGWFQPAVTLYDPQGKEVAFADHYEFHPDPVLLYDVPQDGTYALEVRDTIYRGREDFVYRIAIGELPFITSAFPLGARAGSKAASRRRGLEPALEGAATRHLVRRRRRAQCLLPGQGAGCRTPSPTRSMTCPRSPRAEPNDDAAHAQAVELPVVANGRIGKPGDVDVYKIQGHAGEKVVADVVARRVGSPLDSLVRVIDSSGKVVGLDDDYMPTDGYLHPDMGVITHEADSYLQVKLPADGAYYVQVSDAQGHGGPAYAYRVRISAPQPDFRLLMDPSSLVLAPGAAARVTVHVLRQDGFAGGVDVALKDAPRGVGLAGGKIPADKESAEMRITAQAGAPVGPVDLQLEGSARIGGKSVTRPVTPADDQMQAFLWRHLVPTQQLVAVVRPGRGQFGRGAGGRNGGRPQLPRGIKPPSTVKVPAGGSAEVRFNFPGAMRTAGLLHLELLNPPGGVSISKVRVVPGGVTFELKAEGKAAAVGHKGKLTVEAFAQRPNGPAPVLPRQAAGVLVRSGQALNVTGRQP